MRKRKHEISTALNTRILTDSCMVFANTCLVAISIVGERWYFWFRIPSLVVHLSFLCLARSCLRSCLCLWRKFVNRPCYLEKVKGKSRKTLFVRVILVFVFSARSRPCWGSTHRLCGYVSFELWGSIIFFFNICFVLWNIMFYLDIGHLENVLCVIRFNWYMRRGVRFWIFFYVLCLMNSAIYR